MNNARTTHSNTEPLFTKDEVVRLREFVKTKINAHKQGADLLQQDEWVAFHLSEEKTADVNFYREDESEEWKVVAYLIKKLEGGGGQTDTSRWKRVLPALEPRGTIPHTGWSDTDLFEVNYPDNIQVQIDRTEADEIEVVLWKIGDDHPLDSILFHLPAKTDCAECGDRVGHTELNSDRLCRECRPSEQDEEFLARLKACLAPDYIGEQEPQFYKYYRASSRVAATFIICGSWTISKQRTEDGIEYLLEKSGSVGFVKVDAFKDVWSLARRLMEEDAKQVIDARLENAQIDQPVF